MQNRRRTILRIKRSLILRDIFRALGTWCWIISSLGGTFRDYLKTQLRRRFTFERQTFRKHNWLASYSIVTAESCCYTKCKRTHWATRPEQKMWWPLGKLVHFQHVLSHAINTSIICAIDCSKKLSLHATWVSQITTLLVQHLVVPMSLQM